MKIVLDAMGGDHAPGCVIDGAARAVESRTVRADQLLVAGPGAEIRALLDAAGLTTADVLDAPEVVGMNESPTSVIRTKKRSSIVLGMRAAAEGQAQAFVSAGNTGAVVGAASLVLGRLKGIARPGIAAPMPTRSGPCVVIDVGANIYCKPVHMLQYAIMADEYSRGALGKTDPVVGLLNIGEEEGKGNPLIQEVHALLQASDVRYAGFVEGQDIMRGSVDVVVCEGFVGNVILKVAEGLATFIGEQVFGALKVHPPRPEVGAAISEAFAHLDYAEYGGAPLLGVAAPVIIGHGRSDARAVMNMLGAAQSAVTHDINRHILERLAQSSGKTVP